MSESDTESCCSADLPELMRLIATNWRTIAAGAVGFLIVAVIGTTVKAPVYEATAFLEIDDESEMPTVEEKLRFPSLYRGITENEEAAGDLARRTRIRGRRGSRIVGVTVAHSEPAAAAGEADALVEAFLSNQRNASDDRAAGFQREVVAGLYDRIAAIDSLPDPEAADSPEVLAVTWRTQQAELNKLNERYTAEHQAVAGARQRLEKLQQRIRDNFAALRKGLKLPAGDFDRATFENQVDLMVAEIISIRESRAVLQSHLRQLEAETGGPKNETAVAMGRFAEAATPPLKPAGLPPFIIWFGGLALGAFSGFLVVLWRRI